LFRDRLARFFLVVGFDGLDVPVCTCGVLKPLFFSRRAVRRFAKCPRTSPAEWVRPASMSARPSLMLFTAYSQYSSPSRTTKRSMVLGARPAAGGVSIV
jgi:hypothetical protein